MNCSGTVAGYWLLVCCRFRREQLQHATPSALRVNLGPHLLPARAVALEMAMLQIHAGRPVTLRRESHLYLARPGQIRLIFPHWRDLPSHHEASRRIPVEHLSPIGLRAVFLLGITAPARAAFDYRLFHRRGTNVMRSRPPRVDSFREDTKRALRARLHDDALSNLLIFFPCHC